MEFNLKKNKEILKRTPNVLYSLLKGISDDWIYNNEGENTWSVFDVVGHLILCEKENFIPRTEIILSEAKIKMLPILDMTPQFETNRNKNVFNLLEEFEELRNNNLKRLSAMNLSEIDLNKTAIHPQIGEVKLYQILATWLAHDLNHIAQITRIMAFQYKNEVGKFIQFLSLMK